MLAIAHVQSALFTIGLQNTTEQTFTDAGFNASVVSNLTAMAQAHMVRARGARAVERFGLTPPSAPPPRAGRCRWRG
jgi:hypothetical protein